MGFENGLGPENITENCSEFGCGKDQKQQRVAAGQRERGERKEKDVELIRETFLSRALEGEMYS